MLVTTHALIGGLIASKISNPALAYPLILASHFPLDYIPHWDFGSAVGRQKKVPLFLAGLLDLTMAFLSCWLMFKKISPSNLTIWGGTLMGILPDVIELPALFLDFRPFPLNIFEKYHSHLWHRTQKSFFWGVLPQVVILALVLLFR